MKKALYLFIPLIFTACGSPADQEAADDCQNCQEDSLENDAIEISAIKPVTETSIVVLGTCQDAGSPQINCHKACCENLHSNPDPSRMVVSLGVVDPVNGEKYIFEATPDFPKQLSDLQEYLDYERDDVPDGVFLTHAHIGHYTGLMHFGKEAMNADNVPVFAMPRMKEFLKSNGPWSQLVSTGNIQLFGIFNEDPVLLSNQLKVEPFLVPHRDEYSETVGYKIIGPNKSALFIPDIDKWEKWETDISTLIQTVDYAFLDATFYDGVEINNRDISDIPHPFVIESMDKFDTLSDEDKSKIYFIHFNHTNPLLDKESEAYKNVISTGFNVAEMGDVFSL